MATAPPPPPPAAAPGPHAHWAQHCHGYGSRGHVAAKFVGGLVVGGAISYVHSADQVCTQNSMECESADAF